MTKEKNFMALIFSISIICVLVVTLVMKFTYVISDIYIFRDISECENILNLKDENAEFTRYSDGENDKIPEDLTYVKFFGGYYTSVDLEFEIFAYEFENSDDARRYYKSKTGKDSNNNFDFTTSSGFGLTGFSKSKIIAINGNNAYIIWTQRAHLEEIERFLGEIFSVKLCDFKNTCSFDTF